jgi:arylsulfatase A-like enzyme
MRILYLDIDTLRADHLGCYGYHRDTSPNIDRIAAEGMRFDEFYCTDAPCLPSRAAMTTGRFGIHNGVINHGGTCADRPPDGPERWFRDSLSSGGSFVNVLRDAGLYTCYVGAYAERHSAYWYHAGFHETHDTAHYGGESAEEVTPTALDWIERNADRQDWYLYVNYWDPHTPYYRMPDEWHNPFGSDPLPEWMTEEILASQWNKVGPHSPQDFGAMYDSRPDPRHPRHPTQVKGMEGWRQVIDGYDGGIRYADEHIGMIVEALKARGVWDDLVVMVTGDHGENFGELGIYGEHGSADYPTCHIPLIVRWPGMAPAGSSNSHLTSNVDLVPTMAEILDRPAKEFWDGKSLAGILSGGDQGVHDQVVLSQCAHVCQRSVRWKNWLYIRTYHDGYHLFPEEQVYDVAADPYEQHDLAEERPEVCHEGAWRLMKWHDNAMATMPRGRVADPMRIVLDEGGPHHARGELEAYCRRLVETGRGSAVEELKRRHPREFRG